ncbi:MAG: diaminopimelate epimerase [Clostridia bacterium]|nr:diaminopimelate epimerase [Clostridia bacterium]
MRVRFTKMHGLGNDYLYVYGEVPPDVAELSKKLSDRRFGAGSDGMIFISPSEKADFSMRIFNADGSEAMMCGNGIRCVGKYVYDKGYTDKTSLRVDTLSGVKRLELSVSGGRVRTVTVDMGDADVGEELRLGVCGEEILLTPVSVGNPHAVIFVPDVGHVPVEKLGRAIEKHEAFPGGVNVEFVSVLGADRLRMRVWERGSGVTSACGTGACASVAAAVKKGFCSADRDVAVVLDGGTLTVRADAAGKIVMTGPAETVYEGETVL